MSWDTESYPGEWAEAAEQSRRRRERNLSLGWHRNGWQARSAGEPMMDSSWRRDAAYAETRAALRADEVTSADEALDWLASHSATHMGPS